MTGAHRGCSSGLQGTCGRIGGQKDKAPAKAVRYGCGVNDGYSWRHVKKCDQVVCISCWCT